uniref:Class II aldolase/adducin N-terminal domain-containing protein n=1 Tax=Acrobeloides nanus TaxID=290746 RepID=A0A914DIB5_9BILA
MKGVTNLQYRTAGAPSTVDPPAIIPIDDIPEDSPYSEEEKDARKKLAACYRLVDYFKWTQIIYNHITFKVPGTEDILINPLGLQYYEITANSLAKISLDGKILDRGTTKYSINRAGYILHAAIHEVRHDIYCTIHMHNTAIAAVSAMKFGLLPINQEAMIIGPVAYMDYTGILDAEEEKELLKEKILDPKIKVLFLRNHGFVAMGETAEQAWLLTYYTVVACETQVKTLSAGLENIVIPKAEAVQQAYELSYQGANGHDDQGWKPYRHGELEWEAWMRELDTRGYVTGHKYQEPH